MKENCNKTGHNVFLVLPVKTTVFLSLASSSYGVVIKLDKKEKFNSVLICLDTPWYFLLHKRCIKATFSKTVWDAVLSFIIHKIKLNDYLLTSFCIYKFRL